MPTINQKDWKAMLGCITRLHECEDLEHFARIAMTDLPLLVGADHSTFNYIAPTVPQVRVMAFPEVSNHSQRQRTFSRYVSQHPVLNHYLATGDGIAFKISDFQSVREYHALGLYQNFYRELRYEDQMAIELFAPASELISLAFARDRRTFTERDRQLLNLLRPHLARAYRHVEKVALLKRGLQSSEQSTASMRVTAVLLDAQDRPVQFGPEAQLWIKRFFPEHSRDASRLPDEVTDWLRQTRCGGSPKFLRGLHRQSLRRSRGGQCLSLRAVVDPATANRMLVLGLDSLPDAARSCLAGLLTSREIQVEQGKTNIETAAALGISPLTVRSHLEHIFEKLSVPSRTAAVTAFRRYCSVPGNGSDWNER